jgi:hypothetical protein
MFPDAATRVADANITAVQAAKCAAVMSAEVMPFRTMQAVMLAAEVIPVAALRIGAAVMPAAALRI